MDSCPLARYASSCALCSQLCLSKSSCATRLNASAAIVLSRRGVVMPHGQREQHQPLKSSPSTRIRRLSINKPSICVEVGARVCDGRTRRTRLSRAADQAHNLRLLYALQVPKVLRPCLGRTVTSGSACGRARTGPRYILTACWNGKARGERAFP